MSNKQNDPSKSKKVECADVETVDTRNLIVNVTHPLRYYEFTRDEIKALEECDKESFYRRCIPFSTAFATATYAAVKYGELLKRNPHLGALPKVLIAYLFGYFYGRYSYLPHCEQKLIRLPANSHLGNTMRLHHYNRQCNAK